MTVGCGIEHWQRIRRSDCIYIGNIPNVLRMVHVSTSYRMDQWLNTNVGRNARSGCTVTADTSVPSSSAVKVPAVLDVLEASDSEVHPQNAVQTRAHTVSGVLSGVLGDSGPSCVHTDVRSHSDVWLSRVGVWAMLRCRSLSIAARSSLSKVSHRTCERARDIPRLVSSRLRMRYLDFARAQVFVICLTTRCRKLG